MSEEHANKMIVLLTHILDCHRQMLELMVPPEPTAESRLPTPIASLASPEAPPPPATLPSAQPGSRRRQRLDAKQANMARTAEWIANNLKPGVEST